MARILVVDDDHGFRASLVETLESLGHEVVEAHDGETALAALSKGGVQAVMLDYRLGRDLGTEVLREARSRFGEKLPPVLMLTAYADAHGTIEAMRLGAFDHLAKPIGRGEIQEFLRKALTATASAEDVAGADAFEPMSPAMREVNKLIGRAAASDATVLITGETGAGKEVAARTLHQFSTRAQGPFIAINCAAVPAELLESELFGHVKGAFSGALATRVGSFEQANHGTLMLDEIGDMPLAMQAKILRVLQERRLVRLGDTQERQLDVRVIAATHRDLPDMVSKGEFRQDLFFRLNVLCIDMPPLRERRDDIVPLAKQFLREQSGPARTLSPSAQERLREAPWPGNVRELRNAMERVGVMVSGGLIDAADLDFLSATSGQSKVDTASRMPAAVASLERDLVIAALTEAKGNRADAARRLGISRAQLYRKLSSLGIDPNTEE